MSYDPDDYDPDYDYNDQELEDDDLIEMQNIFCEAEDKLREGMKEEAL